MSLAVLIEAAAEHAVTLRILAQALERSAVGLPAPDAASPVVRRGLGVASLIPGSHIESQVASRIGG